MGLIGEIGGIVEEQADAFITKEFTNPKALYIAGRLAPPGKRMGQAAAIISGGNGIARGRPMPFEKWRFQSLRSSLK